MVGKKGPGIIRLNHLRVVGNNLNPENLLAEDDRATNKEVFDILELHQTPESYQDRIPDLEANIVALSKNKLLTNLEKV